MNTVLTGVDAHNDKYDNKIKLLLDKNSDKPYLKSFLNFLKAAPSTKYMYCCYVSKFIKTTGKDLGEIDIEDYINYIAELKGTPSYRISVFSALKKFSSFSYKTKRSKEDFMLDVEKPKFSESIETVQKRETGYLEKNEIKQLLDAIDSGVGNNSAKLKQKHWNARDKALILLDLTTGLRISGIYKLDVESIDLEKGELITLEKGSKIRTASLTDDTIAALKEWLILRDNMLDGKNETALFISNRRKRLDTGSIYQVVKKYSSVIKDKNISPHKLRATYGTQLYAATGDIYVVQQNMSHSSPQTSERYIRGQAKVADLKAKEVMNNLLDLN